MELKTTIYSSQRKTGFINEIKAMFSDLFTSRELAKRLFIRDKKAEYRQSLLGVMWAFITPLINALVWIFLSMSGAVKIETDQLPYPLFVFIGSMLWSIFSESINSPLVSTNGAKALISKINFPKEAILLSGFYKTIFNSAIKLLIIAIALIFFQINPGIQIVYGLLMIVFLIFVGNAIGLLITPIGMLYKDVGRGIPLVLSFAMYTTPVVYQEMKNPFLAKLVNVNPLTPIINSTRNLLTGYSWDQPMYLLLIFVISIFVMLIGWIFYRISIPIIVERM
ncbi:ABC transporter permease [Empedobacter brevis]|uniref:ABC transporter permease n=1 Tax=Empedobacter brevis TaxID=247 RepID=UPI00289F57F8|nr:ABC transporter permease [Empedobacter brevis]